VYPKDGLRAATAPDRGCALFGSGLEHVLSLISGRGGSRGRALPSPGRKSVGADGRRAPRLTPRPALRVEIPAESFRTYNRPAEPLPAGAPPRRACACCAVLSRCDVHGAAARSHRQCTPKARPHGNHDCPSYVLLDHTRPRRLLPCSLAGPASCCPRARRRLGAWPRRAPCFWRGHAACAAEGRQLPPWPPRGPLPTRGTARHGVRSRHGRPVRCLSRRPPPSMRAIAAAQRRALRHRRGRAGHWRRAAAGGRRPAHVRGPPRSGVGHPLSAPSAGAVGDLGAFSPPIALQTRPCHPRRWATPTPTHPVPSPRRPQRCTGATLGASPARSTALSHPSTATCAAPFCEHFARARFRMRAAIALLLAFTALAGACAAQGAPAARRNTPWAGGGPALAPRRGPRPPPAWRLWASARPVLWAEQRAGALGLC
jgi:hypothetical protein